MWVGHVFRMLGNSLPKKTHLVTQGADGLQGAATFVSTL